MAFPTGWSGYAEATIVNPASALTDFTYLISLNSLPSGFWDAVIDGQEIRFTDGSNNQLPGDLISFTDSGSSGSGLVALKFSPASSGTQKLRIWAGMAGQTFPVDSDTYGADNAYDANYKGFWPSGGGSDRTVNANDFTMTGSPTVGGAAGPINGSTATDYNGSSQYGKATASVPTAAPMLLIVMGASDNNTSNLYAMTVGDTGVGTTEFNGLNFGGAASGDPIRAITFNSGSSGVAVSSTGFSTGTYCHAMALFTSTSSRQAGINGTLGSAQTSVLNPSGIDSIGIGASVLNTVTSYFDGKLSLVSLHNSARSSAWRDYHKLMLQDADQSDIYGTWVWNAVGGSTVFNPLTGRGGAAAQPVAA